MDEKGIIKFECFHEYQELDKTQELADLIRYRNVAHQKRYIGVYPNGIGYGNISQRTREDFLISGSATGMISRAGREHFSLVKKWDFRKNQLWCEGNIKASSESMTHAVIYENQSKVQAVLHIHSSELWKKHYQHLPSTSADIEYGTPEMAIAVADLINAHRLNESGIFLMKGHQDGIVAYGNSLSKVLELIDSL